MFPLLSSFAFTTFTSTSSKLSFSLIANAIKLSAIDLTSFALLSVVSILPCTNKSVVWFFSIANLWSVGLPSFLIYSQFFHLPFIYNFSFGPINLLLEQNQVLMNVIY